MPRSQCHDIHLQRVIHCSVEDGVVYSDWIITTCMYEMTGLLETHNFTENYPFHQKMRDCSKIRIFVHRVYLKTFNYVNSVHVQMYVYTLYVSARAQYTVCYEME